ncbi:Armadillo repeat-containing protein 3 [Cladochytrium tenue]|nr:Armadillo repeat-containing protein 3 [Cladochytrium tenue]
MTDASSSTPLSTAAPAVASPTTFAIADVKTLILLLASPDAPTCVTALDALTRLAETATRNRVQLLNAGVLTPLLGLAASKDASVKKAAAACLAATTEIGDIHPEMRRKDLLERIISLLATDEAPEVQDEAAFAAANLAKDFSNKTTIRNLGGMKALIRLLESPDPDVKKNSALALSILLEDFTNRTELRYLSGVVPLLEVLSSEFQEIQENALLCLIHAAGDYNNRIEIRQCNGIKRLIGMLSLDTPDLHHLVLTCLANCLEESETASMFPDIDGIGPVMRHVQGEGVKAKRNAAIVLARVARTERNQNLLREAGAVTALTTCLSHADASVASSACIGVSALARSEMNQLEFLKQGVPETLVRLMAGEDQSVCRQAALAFSVLCLNAKVRSKIKLSDSLVAIVKLLQSDDAQTIINAAECVSNIADDTDNQAVLSRDFKLDGIGKLVHLIVSKDVEVARAAAYALSAAAPHEPNSIEACERGAIEALLTVSADSSNKAAKFAKDALDKLLNYS